ncbi:MAG: DDE-type integrase/transposase/recombinase, partial [Nitrososphaerota archaeon]
MNRIGVGLGRLIGFFGDRDVFPRLRTPPWVRALGVRLYVGGLSLRRVAGILGELGFQVSHESVRDWFNRAGEVFSSIARRGPIAVDETVIRNLVRRAYLWAAREVGTGEVMVVQVSRGRGIDECIRFLEVVRDRCANNPTVYTDRAPWYGWPMKVLGLRRRVETLGRRNAIESWFSKLKRRI